MALAGLLMASCSDDNDPFGPNGGGQATAGRELTFVFPGTAQGVVPYSAEASAAENELKTVDIYVFGEDSMSTTSPKPMVLEEIFRSGVAADGTAGDDNKGYALNTSGDSKTATISVGSGDKKAFYFVANGREHISLDSVALHVTDTAAFKKKVSNTLKGHISCPMLMSAMVDMPSVKNYVAGATPVNVELVRRVARFDVKNDSETSNFVIREIVLKDVPGNVPLFPMADYEAPRVASMPIIDFTALPGSNAGETNSVFYLYPTRKSETVVLSLVGKSATSGADQVLDVEFKEYKTEAQIDITENNRYLIQVQDMGSGDLEATLRVIEWIVGDTVNVETGHGTIKLSSEATEFKDNTLTLAAEPALADSTLISVAADGQWELVVEDQYKDWIGVNEVASDEVAKQFKVTTLLPNPSSIEVRQGVVMVQNVARPSIRQPLVVRQAPQDKATGRYIDLSGMMLAGNQMSFSGEKTDLDSLNITVDAPETATWTVSHTGDWFTLEKEALLKASDEFKGATGTETFSVVPQQNTTDKERVDTITIKIEKAGEYQSDLIQTIVVRQAARNLGSIVTTCRGINLSTRSVNVSAAGFPEEDPAGLRQIKVNATTEWEVLITDGDGWFTVEKPDGQEGDKVLVNSTFNGYFYVKAAENKAEDAVERTAIVRVQNKLDNNIYQEITFVQEAEPTLPADALELAASSLSWTNSESGTKTIDVTTASSEWTLGVLPSWITATATTGTVDTDIELTLKTEGVTVPFFEDKTATIDVTVGTETKQITVTWKAETVTLSATDPATIAVEGNTGSPVEVAVTCNDEENWSVSKEEGADWLTVTQNGANVEVEAAAFEGGIENRTAIVTVTSTTQPSVTTTFTVTQAFQ